VVGLGVGEVGGVEGSEFCVKKEAPEEVGGYKGGQQRGNQLNDFAACGLWRGRQGTRYRGLGVRPTNPMDLAVPVTKGGGGLRRGSTREKKSDRGARRWCARNSVGGV